MYVDHLLLPISWKTYDKHVYVNKWKYDCDKDRLKLGKTKHNIKC